jgi:imidazoleglycerol-phosphate dehydratase
MRIANIERKTKETEIAIEINLDGTGDYQINTGIGFFDHMLTQIAVHGLCDLKIKAVGDLQIDPHHTVEDCGLVIGSAFGKALGDKAGIERAASAFYPMDDALAQAVVDFSGRPYSVIKVNWSAPTVGGLDTTLVEHFFQSFSVGSGSNLHLQVHYGKDNHHIAEAMFKAFARAAMAATRIDPRRSGKIPSSKGVI